MTPQVEIFPWNENFETGIKEIDFQHKRLIELLNLLVGHLAYQADAPAIEKVFEELKSYTQTHFSAEEQIWHRYFKGDPWEEWHKNAHIDFIERVREIHDNAEGHEYDQVVEEIVTFLTHWLAMHIIESDKRMAKVVKALPSGVSLEQAKDLANLEMSGATRLLIDTVMGMYDKLANRTVSLTREISRRMKVEAELNAAQEELVRLRDEAMAANRAKSEFLANMSHELRSPLHTVLGFSNLLLREAESGQEVLSNAQQESLQTVRRSGEHLLTVINNILELSRIEAGDTPVEITSFDLPELIRELEQMFALSARDKGLQLSCLCSADSPQWVRGDEIKLRQVLINLMANAVKFTQSGHITLQVSARNDTVHFSVEDTGPGLSEDEIRQLFVPFNQTASGRRQKGGTGLGLAISRQFVALLGGEIMVSSTPGQGSRFEFSLRLPVSNPETEEKRTEKRMRIGLKLGMPVIRILVVDDDAGSRQLISRLLSPMGFSVREAADGQQALAACEKWQPRLVWMDIRMPGMDGIEATRRLRATPAGQQAKIIALTTSCFEEDRQSMFAAGCDDFALKPFRESELLQLLAKHLELPLIED